jgi:hypothetical protein
MGMSTLRFQLGLDSIGFWFGLNRNLVWISAWFGFDWFSFYIIHHQR